MLKQTGSILLVDDEQLNLDMLSRRLSRSGFSVEVATDGPAALEKVQQQSFDLVLLDHMMPGMSGPEVLQKIRQRYSPAELPVIMVTAVAESDKIADALGSGANDYVTKPIDYRIALARIQVQLERRQAEMALRSSEQRYALAMEASRDALWEWNLVDDTLFLSPRWSEMLGLEAASSEAGQDFWFDRVFAPDLPALQQRIQDVRSGAQSILSCDYRVVNRDGDLRWMVSRALATRDDSGRTVRLSGSQSDVTDERTTDALTGLKNRTALVSRLEQLFLQKARHEASDYALLFLDLDGFKAVNDSLGHLAGDRLLRIIATRLGQAVLQIKQARSRALLPERVMIARMGGDEFAVLVESDRASDIADMLAAQVQELMSVPAALEGRSIYCAFSIGVASSSEQHTNASDIVREADTAMYAAKSEGKGRVATFSPGMRQAALDGMELENDLCDAVAKGQMRLVYQPKVRLDTGAIYGVEALLRWDHPERGVVLPAIFIPIAEKTEAILRIGEWVLREACTQVAQWQAMYPEYRTLELSVNLSPSEFRKPTLVADIAAILRETGFTPELLHLEITEGVLFQDFEAARGVLTELRRLGTPLDLDDFGSGFSSLRYLQELPFDTLKIDRYFISALDSGRASSAEVIRTIILMANTLSLDVIAEGVETAPHTSALREMGCRYGQGYFFSKPVTPEMLEEMLRTARPEPMRSEEAARGLSALSLPMMEAA